MKHWGPQEVIAVIVIIGAFVLAFVALFTSQPDAKIPAWVAVMIGGAAFYLYRNGKEK